MKSSDENETIFKRKINSWMQKIIWKRREVQKMIWDLVLGLGGGKNSGSAFLSCLGLQFPWPQHCNTDVQKGEYSPKRPQRLKAENVYGRN